jgi:hypothetical protein
VSEALFFTAATFVVLFELFESWNKGIHINFITWKMLSSRCSLSVNCSYVTHWSFIIDWWLSVSFLFLSIYQNMANNSFFIWSTRTWSWSNSQSICFFYYCLCLLFGSRFSPNFVSITDYFVSATCNIINISTDIIVESINNIIISSLIETNPR